MTRGTSGRLAVLVVTAWLLPPWGLARADELRSKLEQKLVDIKRDLFDARGVASVAVGDFTGAASLDASGGPAVSNAMIDAFQKFGLTVDRNAIEVLVKSADFQFGKARAAITVRYNKSVEPGDLPR